jgi:uncharacterized membrane protein
MLLAVAAVAGGFIGFLLALLLGGVGYVAGRYFEGARSVDDVLRPKRKPDTP